MAKAQRRQLEVLVSNDNGKIARCLVRRGRYMIGHDIKNEIVADDPTVSARHARLTVVSDGEIYIEDFGSANGTWVNDRPAEGLTRVDRESSVMVGGCRLKLHQTGEEPEHARPVVMAKVLERRGRRTPPAG